MPVQRLDQLGLWYDISRTRLGRSAAVGLPPVSVANPATDPTIRPTGPEYVRYEDLYQSGDTVTAAMARLTTPKIITFPEGKFECVDFATGYQAGITIPPVCQGIVGSGKGYLGGASGTIFTIKPNSSTAVGKGWIPTQSGQATQVNVMKHYPNQPGPKTYQNFQVAGTAQGHVFHCMQVFGTLDVLNFTDVLLTGWEGDSGAPPGETFGLQVSGVGAHSITRLEADGRRTPGGQVFGATGLTFQKCVGARFTKCNVHHCRASTYAFYNSANNDMVDCIADATVTGGEAIKQGSVNLEAFTATRLIRPTVIGRVGWPHITASSDQGTLTRDGVTWSFASGTLEIVDPVNNVTVGGSSRLCVQTWDPYSRGPDTVGVSTYKYPADAPSVHKADGTPVPYRWILAGTHYLIN